MPERKPPPTFPRGLSVVIAILATMASVGTAELTAQEWRTVTLSRRQAASASGPLQVELEYMAGSVLLRSGSTDELYHLRLRYDSERYQPVASLDGSRLRLGVDRRRGADDASGDEDEGELTARLGRGVPMSLTVQLGAVVADLDVGGLSLTELDISTGASEARVDVSEPNATGMARAEFNVGVAEFAARRLGNLNAEEIDVSAGVGDITLDLDGVWQRDAEVSVEMKLGKVEIRAPRELGVKLVDRRSFLASLDADGLVGREDGYYSENWDRAERRVTVEVETTFGAVRFGWIR